MKFIAGLVVLLSLVSCSGTMRGRVVAERPSILDDPRVVRIDPKGDGTQVSAFLAAHHARRTAGLCQGMLSEELTSSDWCLVTEFGTASMVVDYTQDPLGVDGYRVQPVQYKGRNKFFDMEARQEILLEPWSPN